MGLLLVLFFFWLIVPPIIAIFRRNAILLQVFPDRIRLTRGLLPRCYRDCKPRDIRSIDEFDWWPDLFDDMPIDMEIPHGNHA